MIEFAKICLNFIARANAIRTEATGVQNTSFHRAPQVQDGKIHELSELTIFFQKNDLFWFVRSSDLELPIIIFNAISNISIFNFGTAKIQTGHKKLQIRPRMF